MKKVDRKKRSWRVVRTPTREQKTIPVLTKGLQLSEDPELTDLSCVSTVDGFTVYSGLFRKDWALGLYSSQLVDNIATTAASVLPECAA